MLLSVFSQASTDYLYQVDLQYSEVNKELKQKAALGRVKRLRKGNPCKSSMPKKGAAREISDNIKLLNPLANWLEMALDCSLDVETCCILGRQHEKVASAKPPHSAFALQSHVCSFPLNPANSQLTARPCWITSLAQWRAPQ